MIVRKAFLVMVSLILLTGSFIFLIPDGEAAAEEQVDDQPVASYTITTDIVVNGGETRTFNGDNVLMQANIWVSSGGTLNIINCNFVWDCTSYGSSGGQYKLHVYSGAILYIEGSTMTAQDTTTRVVPSTTSYWTETWGYKWEFEIWGDAYIGNSTLSYLWGDDGTSSSTIEGGVQIYSSNVLINQTTISNATQSGIFIANSDYPSTSSGYDPVLRNVTVMNTQGRGLKVYGRGSNPFIRDCTFKDSSNWGSHWYYAYPSLLTGTDFLNNGKDGYIDDGYDQGWGLFYYISSYDYFFYADNCKFNNNDGSGVGQNGDADMFFTDCEFNGNTWSGIESYSSSYDKTITLTGCDFKNNDLYGIDAYYYRTQVLADNCDISGNLDGVHVENTPPNYLAVTNSEIYNNLRWGVYFNHESRETTGAISNCDIHNNVVGNIYITNGSNPSIDYNDIRDSPFGLLVETGGFLSSLMENDFTDNNVNIEIRNRSMDFSSNNITGGNIGVLIEEGVSVNLVDFKIANTVDTAVDLVENGEIGIFRSAFLNNNKDVKLDGESEGWAYNTAIPKNNVQIIDSLSDFTAYWTISLIVVDNVSFDPIGAANVIVYGKDMDIILELETDLLGEVSGWAPEYTIQDGVTTDYSPINITVVKNGYVPYWGGNEPFTMDIDRTIVFSRNRAPKFPFDPILTPELTHMQKPTIEWTKASDWNDDVIKYRINVYLDDLYTGDIIVRDEILRESKYTFTKNLRYNRAYWLEVEAYDDWGLSDIEIFSFRTINTPPSMPEIGLLESKVSTKDDITIVILNESIDDDVNPVDQIIYLVEWYAYREESWVLLASGIDLTTLTADKTREGEDIKVIVKAYDGIGYGEGVEMIIPVVNFVPVNLIDFVDIEIDEDIEGIDLVNLKSLFADRDGDELSFRVKSERHVFAVIDTVTNNVSFNSETDWAGTDQVIIEAFDTKMHDEDWPFITINVTVNPINDAPSIDFVNDERVGFGEIIIVQGIQGSTEVITVIGSDPDEIFNDEFSFSTNFLEVIGEDTIPEKDLLFETTSGRLSVYLSNALVGETIFNITVTDLLGEFSSVPIRLLVENTNDAMTDPEIIGLSNGDVLVQAEDGEINFIAAESDDPDLYIPDSEEKITYEWDFGDGTEPLTNAGRDVTHSFLVEGNYTITLTVRDSFGMVKTASVRVFIDLPDVDDVNGVEDKEDNGRFVTMIVILVIVIILFVALILFFIFRKDPLEETAEIQEQEHEALVAQQQQDALIAQDKLQALLSGTAYTEVSGPALPPAQAEGADLEVPPEVPPEEVPGQEPPMEPVPEQPMGFEQPPPVEQAPMQEPPGAPEPAPEPIPETPAPEPEPAPMQAAPAGTVPVPETPEAQSNLPPQEEQQQ
jgi:flagellar basal body-associated protein FliL